MFLQTEVPRELTKEWQIANNSGYSDLMDFFDKKDVAHKINYDEIIKEIRNYKFNNGLSPEENEVLFRTPFKDKALRLIFKGLKSLNQI